MREENQNPKHYSCSCSTCRNARKQLKKLENENSSSSYYIVEILKEVLGEGNY